MSEHRFEVPADPNVRISNLIEAYRAAPLGADLEIIAGSITKESDPECCAPALVITINSTPFPVTLPEAETCATMIDVTLDLLELPDRESLVQFAKMLRWAVKRTREEDANGHHHLH